MIVPNKPFVLRYRSYKTVVSSFTLRCRSPRQSPGLPWQNNLSFKGRTSSTSSVFEVNKCRVSQSTFSSCKLLVPILSARGAPRKEQKIRHASFFSVFTSCELPLVSLLFPFSCFRCCGLNANLICRLIFSHQSVQVLNKM